MQLDLTAPAHPTPPLPATRSGARSCEALEPPQQEALRTAVVRVATAGSVDDGKSTLIGRLLLDCHALFTDQLEHIEVASKRRGFARTELALVTDGLRAEREQGITIDVAWRYFSTSRRRFVLADTPGHVQYTRNMVTGASQADVAVMLVDAERGPTEQTLRHLAIAVLLAVPRLVVAINKMDRVAFSQARYEALVAQLEAMVRSLGRPASLSFIPVSALGGDHIVKRSAHTPWYDGPTLLEALEQAAPALQSPQGPARMPIQWVSRPQDERFHHYRGLAGRVTSGTLHVGERVVVLPAGLETTIRGIEVLEGPLDSASAGQSVVLHLAEDVDVARGDVIASVEQAPIPVRVFHAEVCWLSGPALTQGRRLLVKHGSCLCRAVVDAVVHTLDVTTGATRPATQLRGNELGKITLRVATPLCVEPYRNSRAMGSLLLIDEASGETVGAAMAC